MAKQIILDTWSDLIAKSEEIYKEYLKDLDNRTVTKKDIDDKISKALSESELNTDVNVDNKISTAISEYEEKDDAQELSLINNLYARIIEELNNRGYITITAAEQKIQEEITKVINGASEDFDTLKEISDWISSHGSSAASMNSQIKKNEADIFTIQTDIETINNTLSTKESIIEHTKDFNTLSVNLANTTIALRDYIDSSIVRIKEIVDTKVDNDEYVSSIEDKVSVTDFNSVISEINSSLSTKVDSATYDEDMLVMKTAIADNTGSATGIKAALEQLEKNLKNYADAGDKAHNSLDIEIDGKLDISVYNIDKDIFISSIDSKVDSSIFNNTIDDVESVVETKVDSSVYENEINNIYNKLDSKVELSVYTDDNSNIQSKLSELSATKVDISVYNSTLNDISNTFDEFEESISESISTKLDSSVFYNSITEINNNINVKVDSSVYEDDINNINEMIVDVEKSFEDKINKKVDTSIYNNKISQLDSSIAEIKSTTDKVATYDVLGMIKVGNDFDISEDGLLTLYQKPSVITFNNNCDNKGANSSNIFEKGTVINKVVLTWILNKTAKTITVDNDDVTGTNSKTYDNLSLSNNKTYALKFTDARNASASATTSIYFRNKIYLGTSSMTGDFDSDFIISLSNKTFATSNSAFGTKTISAGDTEYIYYAAPSSFGTPSWSDGAGIYTFDKMKSFDFINESSYVENYTVWRASDAPGLKNQKIIIS